MPIPFIVIGVAAAAAAIFAGCGSKDDEESSGADKPPSSKVLCWSPPHPLSYVSQQDKFYISDGSNVVIADNQLSKESAEAILKQVPTYKKMLNDFFGIESPYNSIFTLQFYNQKKEAICPSGACAGFGLASFNFYPNDDTATFEIKPENQLSVIMHEGSHALRSGIASPWWGFEEGLARYSGYHLAERAQPKDIAVKILDDDVLIGQVPNIDWNTSEVIEKIYVASVRSDSITLIYSLKERIKDEPPPHQDIEVTMPLNKYTQFWDFIVYPSVDTDQNVHIKLFSIPNSKNYSRPQTLCLQDGLQTNSEFLTEEGYVTVEGALQPYEKLDGYERPIKNGFDVGFGYYQTGFCFWEQLRTAYGHEMVQLIIQDMFNFSKEHTEAATSYPFFERIKSLTGMDENAAHSLFSRFSAPTDSNCYSLGGICL